MTWNFLCLLTKPKQVSAFFYGHRLVIAQSWIAARSARGVFNPLHARFVIQGFLCLALAGWSTAFGNLIDNFRRIAMGIKVERHFAYLQERGNLSLSLLNVLATHPWATHSQGSVKPWISNNKFDLIGSNETFKTSREIFCICISFL